MSEKRKEAISGPIVSRYPYAKRENWDVAVFLMHL